MRSVSTYRRYVMRYYHYVTYFQRFSRAAWTKRGSRAPHDPPKSAPVHVHVFCSVGNS